MTDQENTMFNWACVLTLWCSFLLLKPVNNEIAVYVAGFSGFLLLVLTIGSFIVVKLSNQEEQESKSNKVEVEEEVLSDLFQSAMLLGVMYENGLEQWEGHDVATAIFEDKIKQVEENIKSNGE